MRFLKEILLSPATVTISVEPRTLGLLTVRRVAYGCGVEKTFPLHSPSVANVEVVRKGKVRRSKLYYLRDRVGKASKVKELN